MKALHSSHCLHTIAHVVCKLSSSHTTPLTPPRAVMPQLDRSIAQADVDGDGAVSRSEFVTVVKALLPPPWDGAGDGGYATQDGGVNSRSAWDIDASFEAGVSPGSLQRGTGNGSVLEGRRGFRRSLFMLIATAAVTRLTGGVAAYDIDARVVTYRLFHFCAQFFDLGIGATPHGSATAFHVLQKQEYRGVIRMDQPVSVRTAAAFLGREVFVKISSFGRGESEAPTSDDLAEF